MARMLRTAGMVVAAVAITATTAGLATPAVMTAAGTITTGGLFGVSATTLGAVGTYGISEPVRLAPARAKRR